MNHTPVNDNPSAHHRTSAYYLITMQLSRDQVGRAKKGTGGLSSKR